MKKRLLSFVLILCIVISALPVFAMATDAPSGYTTDANGIMAYCTGDSWFDIKGYFAGEWKNTSWSDCYYTYLKVGDTAKQIELKDGGHDVLGLNVKLEFDFINAGKTLQIKYIVKNNTENSVNFSIGTGTDVQIGNDDYAVITQFDDGSGFKMVSAHSSDKSTAGDYAQFNFFGKDYNGVTSVTDFWYGAYSSSYVSGTSWEGYYWSGQESEAVFFGNANSLSGSEYSGTLDSAATWHWDDTINANETKTYSILIGIGGAGSENAASGGELEDPEGSVSIDLSGIEGDVNTREITVQIGEKTLECGEDKDYTFNFSDDGKTLTVKFNESAGITSTTSDIKVILNVTTYVGPSNSPQGEKVTADIGNGIYYTITVTSDEFGSASASSAKAKAGEEITLSAVAEEGYVFDKWEATPDTVTIDENNSFTMPEGDVTVKAVFKEEEDDSGEEDDNSCIPAIILGGIVYEALEDNVPALMMPEKSDGFDKAVDTYSIYMTDKGFSDVAKSDWFYGDVTALANKGVVGGYPDGSFKPYGEVTWGEALKLVMKAVGYGDIAPTGDHWASGYLETALADLLISGEVELDAVITREEVANLTAQALKLAPAGIEYPFDDYAPEAAVALYAAGIIKGSADNGQLLFRAESTITRAEMAAIIWRVYCVR